MCHTPICDFVRNYAKSGQSRLHMPGHKGREFVGCEKYDITEIDGADVLYSSGGIIRESENIASGLFGTGRTVYSAEGSSLAIRAMLYLVRIYAAENGKAPVIAAGRNAHKTFITAAALADFEIEWIYGNTNDGIISCTIDAIHLEHTIQSMPQKPVAVYITSPDYLGNIADIKSLSAVCQKYGILLLVDNAHGAYLKFLPEDLHPISLGADMCCDSAHKTLPVLTGGAYLHISKTAPAMLAQRAEDAMSVFASTSPSYLILQSLDMANAYIARSYSEELLRVCNSTGKLKSTLTEKGFVIVGNEPTKLTIAPKSYGYTGTELAGIMASDNIICEFSDPDYAVMMFSPQITDDEFQHLENTLKNIPHKMPINAKPPIPQKGVRRMSVREALFSPYKELPVHMCTGHVLASPTVSCPPAIPIAVCGEEINRSTIECFEYYGIRTCRVIHSVRQANL